MTAPSHERVRAAIIVIIVTLGLGLGGYMAAIRRAGPVARPPTAAQSRPSPSSYGSITAQQCLDRPGVTVLSGDYTSQYKVASPPDDHTYDARRATSTAYPGNTLYPLSFGKARPAHHDCFLGGKVVGQQSRSLTWRAVKKGYDGAALQMGGNDWYVIDGLRAENVEDGLRPRGTEGRYPKDGDGFTLRNAYFTHIRDDCISNTDIAGGVVEDSLFDGCYTGFSELGGNGDPQRRFPAPPGETLTLDGVLLRLEAMPGTYRDDNPHTLGHGTLFKWSNVANHLVVRDSVFLVETTPASGRADFPPGTVAHNVTVAWLGPGPFPGNVPAGVTVTTDRSVWDTARARWLARHGCSSFDDCTKLLEPDPQ